MSQTPPERPALEHRATSQAVDHHNKYGRSNNLHFHEEFGEREPPKRLSELFSKPVIRQWVEDGKLYREATPREISRFELFFDLLFVAIIHFLAETAVEEPGGPAVARFILTFWPSWSIWEETRRYSNVSGTDDMLHRLWVLAGMICLMGYTTNATAIELEPHGEEVSIDHTAVHCAAAFWLIIKLTRVIVLWFYAYMLPPFRITQFLSGCAVLVPMCVYLPLLWVTNRHTQIVLASVGIVVDLIRFDVLFYYVYGHWLRWSEARRDRKRVAAGEIVEEEAVHYSANFMQMVNFPAGIRFPAINIEHSIERSSAFVVIVLGELVMNLLYKPTQGEFGASHKYGKAVLGLMIAWGLNFLYTVQTETPFEYQHALRRSWFTGLMFSFLHWPLCASLLLASAAAAEMVAKDEVEHGVKWYWGCGLGFAIIFIVLIDMLHHRVQPWTSERIPRVVRFVFAIGAALALILFPLSSHFLSSIAMMAIALAITWTVLAVYIYGILPTPRALRIIEEEEALNPHPEPEVILEADLRDPHDLRRTETHHSVRSRASAAKSHKSHNTHHEDAERLIAVGS